MENLAGDYLVVCTFFKAKMLGRVKCCLIGDYSVGKTSIVQSYLDNHPNTCRATIGIDFFSKTVSVGSQKVYLTIWDTSGAERFHSLTHSYLRDTDFAILVYDTSVNHSNLVFWMRCIEQYQPKVIGVIGNKTDLTYANKDDMAELLFPWTRQSKVIVHETLSARNPAEVKAFFKRCLKLIVTEEPVKTDLQYVKLEPTAPKNRTCCT